MSTLRLIDNREKFSIEIDGTEIPYVTTYQITRTVGGIVMVNLSLSVNDVDSVEIVSDKIERRNTTDAEIKKNRYRRI